MSHKKWLLTVFRTTSGDAPISTSVIIMVSGGNGSRKRGKFSKEVRSGVRSGIAHMNGETDGLLRHQLALHQQTIISSDWLLCSEFTIPIMFSE
jgi:hypothetical protein